MVALRGRKQVGTLTSAERGSLVIAVICSCATGTFVPPMLIFSRVRMKEAFLEGAPSDTKLACHPSGWIQLHLCAEWFDHFLLHSQTLKKIQHFLC